MDLLISRDINYDFMVLNKGVDQDPNIGVKIFHTSIYEYSKAIDSDKEENNDNNAPKTPYDVENMNASFDDEGNNAYSNNEGNNDEVAPEPPTNDVNINANSDDEINY